MSGTGPGAKDGQGPTAMELSWRFERDDQVEGEQ